MKSKDIIVENSSVLVAPGCSEFVWAIDIHNILVWAPHSQLNSNPSGNRQLLWQTNVGTVSDFLTVCLFSKGPVRDNLNKFVYSTTRTRSIWYMKPGPVQV